MAKLSKAQQSVVDRIKAGGRLFFDATTGLFAIQEQNQVRKVDQRPVEALLLAGVVRKDLVGCCSLVDSNEIQSPTVLFRPGDQVFWSQSGKSDAGAEVTSATSKQVRILVHGEHRVVRPDALRLQK